MTATLADRPTPRDCPRPTLTGASRPAPSRRTREGNARYLKEYRLRTERNGGPLLVPAGPVIEHLEALRSTMSVEAVAATAGIPVRTVKTIPRQRSVTGDTAKAVLAVQVGRPIGAFDVDATGTRRRMQALAAMDWPPSTISALVGITRQNGAAILNGKTRQVRAGHAAAVREVYDRLSMHRYQPQTRGQRAHVTRLRTAVAASGWLPPLAWDDDTIDDPRVAPPTSTLRNPTAARKATKR